MLYQYQKTGEPYSEKFQLIQWVNCRCRVVIHGLLMKRSKLCIQKSSINLFYCYVLPKNLKLIITLNFREFFTNSHQHLIFKFLLELKLALDRFISRWRSGGRCPTDVWCLWVISFWVTDGSKHENWGWQQTHWNLHHYRNPEIITN